jgi:hypothetical protein
MSQLLSMLLMSCARCECWVTTQGSCMKVPEMCHRGLGPLLL